METLSRSKGRNAVQMAAYLAGRPIQNWATGRVFRRQTKDSEIKEWKIGTDCDAETIFNLAELTETRKDSVVARHVIVPLPREVSPEKHVVMLYGMGQTISEELNTPVFIFRHSKIAGDGKPNDHGHLLFGTRDWDEENLNFSPRKNRTLDEHKTGAPKIEAFRKRWEEILNENLPPNLLSADRRSHAALGDNCLPRKHLGRQAIEWEKRTGRRSRAREFNQLVDEHNRHIREGTLIEMRIEDLEKAIAEEEKSILAATQFESEAAEVLQPVMRAAAKIENAESFSPAAIKRVGACHSLSQMQAHAAEVLVALTPPPKRSEKNTTSSLPVTIETPSTVENPPKTEAPFRTHDPAEFIRIITSRANKNQAAATKTYSPPKNNVPISDSP